MNKNIKTLYAIFWVAIIMAIGLYISNYKDNWKVNLVSTWSVESKDLSYMDTKYEKLPTAWSSENKNLLWEISSKAEEEFKANELEKQKHLDEYSVTIEKYAQSINKNESILPYISDESQKKIKERTWKIYNGFKDSEKESFRKDLAEVWFDMWKDFNIMNDADFNRYLDFMVKYPVKSKWKIIEVKDINGKYEKSSWILCWTYTYEFEWNSPMVIESLCTDKLWKFLIHNL